VVSIVFALICLTCTTENENGSSAGQRVYQAVHTPCGDTLYETGPVAGSVNYTAFGHETDRALESLDFGARHFSAKLCRFAGTDPIDDDQLAGRSAYMYVGGNLINRVDPDGKRWDWPDDKRKSPPKDVMRIGYGISSSFLNLNNWRLLLGGGVQTFQPRISPLLLELLPKDSPHSGLVMSPYFAVALRSVPEIKDYLLTLDRRSIRKEEREQGSFGSFFNGIQGEFELMSVQRMFAPELPEGFNPVQFVFKEGGAGKLEQTLAATLSLQLVTTLTGKPKPLQGTKNLYPSLPGLQVGILVGPSLRLEPGEAPSSSLGLRLEGTFNLGPRPVALSLGTHNVLKFKQGFNRLGLAVSF